MYVLNPISEHRDFDLSDQIVRKNMYIIVGFIFCVKWVMYRCDFTI